MKQVNQTTLVEYNGSTEVATFHSAITGEILFDLACSPQAAAEINDALRRAEKLAGEFASTRLRTAVEDMLREIG